MSVEEAVAREHIRDTMARYVMAVDERDKTGYLDVFTDDVVFMSPVFDFKNKADVAGYMASWPDTKPPVSQFRHHHLTTCQIDLTGPKTANSRVYYYAMSYLGPDHSGFYVDRWREENGRWLICYREVWMDWANPQSTYVADFAKQQLAEKGICGPVALVNAGQRR